MSAIAGPESRKRLADVRQNLATARKRRAEIQGALKPVEGKQVDGTTAQLVEGLQRELATVQLDIDQGEALERQMLGRMAGVSDSSSFADTIFNNPAIVAEMEGDAFSESRLGNKVYGPIYTKEQLAEEVWGKFARMAAASSDGLVSATPDSRVEISGLVVPQLRRPLNLLDVIPTFVHETLSFEYTTEGGDFTGPAETAEGSIKPSGNIDLEPATATAVTIAGYLKFHRAQLADLPQLQQRGIDRLRYACQLRLENQVINGDGSGANLTGILHTAGIGSTASGDATLPADRILDAISTVAIANANASAVVIHPTDLAAMLKKTASSSGDRLDSSGAFGYGLGVQTIWGVPIVQTTALGVGTALVADFNVACSVGIREALNLRVSDSDQDDFIRNKVTALVEGRFSFPVWQPSAIVKVSLATS